MTIDTLATISLQELAALYAENVLILTVNNRHARRVLGELSATLSSARSVMAAPDVVPLSGWLRGAADQLSFQPDAPLASHVADAFGAQLLWQRVIADEEADRALLDIPQAAKLAAEADRLMDEWHIKVAPEHETADYQRFRVWRQRYRDLLSGMDMEDGNIAYQRLLDAVRAQGLRWGFDTLVLAGFKELSPRFAGLLQALQGQGIAIRRLARPPLPPSSVRRVAAPNPDSEWRMAARWAADQLRRHPAGRYAIIASRLEADVALAHRYLAAELRAGDTGPALAYNVAVARPLAEWPLPRAALSWLQALAEFTQRKSCAPELLGQALLAGGCVADVQEASGRAAMDALWRKRARIIVTAQDFTEQLARHAPQLAQAWPRCLDLAQGWGGPAAADIWMQRFRQALMALGFPGQPALDSHAFQVMEAFDGIMARLAGQSAAAGSLRFGAAVSLLRRLARETPFQPQRDPSARLDVLGFLESEGGRWDGAWVLGLTDEVLPAAPRPNPFIPLAALRLAQAPRATPERELHWAKDMYAALLECAPDVLLSHADHEGERELRPSPCIADLPLSPFDLPRPPAVKPATEALIDEQGPPLAHGSATRGGIGVIDSQARNPLWAFVKYRLGASQLAPYAKVSDQNARGLLLHRAIELIWRMVPDQESLRALQAGGGLDPLVDQAVEQAADECLADYGRTLRRLELERAHAVLRDWLALELARKPFRIRDVEQTYLWSHGPLELSLRLDRIDELADGRLAIMDYKTGNGNIDPRPDWMRARPVGLQLPFYAAVLARGGTQVAALVLARLHAREIQARGLADSDLGLDGLAGLGDWPAFAHYTWDQLMDEWRRVIHGLADEFVGGHAANRSARPDDLQYCDVLPFLRLTEEYQRVD